MEPCHSYTNQQGCFLPYTLTLIGDKNQIRYVLCQMMHTNDTYKPKTQDVNVPGNTSNVIYDSKILHLKRSDQNQIIRSWI